MSTEFGSLNRDLPLREVDAGPSEPSPPNRESDAGAWPEEMDDIRFVADSSLTIPGKSEKPDDCGNWGYREFCDSCGEPIPAEHRCQRRLCPDCWLTWRGNDAGSIVERLASARRQADGAQSRLIHGVVSPPAGEITTLVDYWSGFSDAYDLAQEKGVDGGVVMAHGWRVKDRVKREYRRKSDADVITEGGLWQFVRENEKDWRTQVYWSPHYHILGLSADVGANKPGQQDGWVFSRLSTDTYFSMTATESYEAMARMALYILSHVGFQAEEQKQVVRWYGTLSYNKFAGLDALEDWEQSVVRRNVEEVLECDLDDNAQSGSDELEDCPEDGCNGSLRPIWDATDWLADRDWCDQIGRIQQRRLSLAFEMALGDVVPPPGLKNPKSRDDLEEAFEVMMQNRC